MTACFEKSLFRACEEYIQTTSQDPEFCTKVQALVKFYTRSHTDAKKFLADLKQVLQAKSLPNLDHLLTILVPLYLTINNKNAAKKVLSSFFQGLPELQKQTVLQLLCARVQEACKVASMDDSSCEASVRQVVDMLLALMENFALGEACVTAISSTALEFMARCQDFFFRLFRQSGQSAVQVNTLMYDCHVTMQTMNRLTQRHLPRDPQHLSLTTLTTIMRKDIHIMMDEHMMVDCRCCCAINLVLLLQITQPDFVPQVVINWLGSNTEALVVPEWLNTVDLLQLRMSSISPMTSLALLWGMLSMLNSSTISLLIEPEVHLRKGMGLDSSEGTDSVKGVVARADSTLGDTGKLLVCEVILRKLLSLDEICQSTASRVQCIKTVTLWSARMMSCLKEPAVPAEMQHRLRGQGISIQSLLNFVWTHWQDQLDAMRQNSRIIFDNCLKIHVIAAQCENASTDQFLLSLLHHVLEMGWSSHSKFAALTSLARCLGALPILLHDPSFPVTLLLHMTDQGLVCHASELYEVLISQEKLRAEEAGRNDEHWLDVWVEPIIRQLCSSDKKLKQFIIEYILPKVMKKDKTVLEYMLNRLSSSNEKGNEHLGALIVCLRRARAWGLLSEALHTQDSSAPIWTKIHSALSSPEEQVRLDAFALLCESKRTSEMISEVEFQHIRHFITYNLNNQSPAFRQTILAFVKKLFFRINESQQAMLRLKKKKEKDKETSTPLQAYNKFLCWLQEFLFCQLYPSSAFARRTMSMAILSLLVQELHAGKDAHGFKPLSDITDNHIHTLLECLTDTFEENKQEAFKLLVACTSNHSDLLGEDKCKVLCSAALQLAVSTRPQDCSTAAYLLKLLLHQPCAIAVMSSLKPAFSSSLQSAEEREVSAAGDGCSFSSEERTTGTPDRSNNLTDRTPESKTLKQLWREVEAEDNSTSATLQLLQALLLLLLDQVSVAQTSLILAAANRPIYPTLHCIRYILDGVDFRCLPDNLRPAWTKYMGCLLQVCLQVAAVVSPVVQNSSPEGNIPDEAVLGPGLKFDLGLMAEVEESRQTVSLMPEYLVVCCWRSIKEVSLLLGHLSLNVPITQPGTCQGLFSLQQVEEIGHYFKQQLMESLHRGAFELAYAGFVMMCQMLWKNSWSELQALPRRWLEQVMSAIVSHGESSGLCATRRSAGVPFFIQAIVATETTTSGRPSFHQAISQLLQIAVTSHTSTQLTNTDGQVHALNILRALFKDTRLGEDVAPYVCDGLKAAILGFKSQFWEIRNSATLLLSALMTRIFGVKRSKDESVLSKLNSQTGRAFFHKYPALYTFLLTELEMATQNMGSSGELHLHPSLYPVLMVLGHLFPSTMEGTTTRLNLAAFIPHVIRCSSSPVYKTRMMAARALQPLAGKEQLTDVLTTLLATLPKRHTVAQNSRLPHSHIHGILLQVYHLLLLSSDLSGSLLLKLGSVCAEGWLPLTWLIERHNPCLCSKKAALDVTDLILSVTSPVKSSMPINNQRDLDTIANDILHVLHSELTPSPSIPHYSPHTPFLSEFLSCVARLSMHYLVPGGMKDVEGDKVALRLLGFDAYEVHLAVLDSLMKCWEGAERSQEGESYLGINNPPRIQVVSDGGYSLLKAEVDGDEGAGRQGCAVMTVAMVTCLLDMGLEEDAHTETVIKIFQLLSMTPAVKVINKLGRCRQVFAQVVSKLKKERSAEVKAALIQFSGCLFPFLYWDLKSEKAEPGSRRLISLFQEWSPVLRTCCNADQPDDLPLSCAYVLRDNCILMLGDADDCLGLLIFDFWSMLVTLLQADDLEVKDIAASVSAKLCLPETGSSHPEQALGQLIRTMFHLHSKTKAFHCLATALSWIMPHTSDLEDGSERLFDKGELNTFQDDVTLVRLVTEILQEAHWTDDSKSSSPVSNSYDKLSSPSPQKFPSQSSNHTSFLCHFHLTKEDEGELMGLVQRVLALAESVKSSAESEKDFLESLYLLNSSYCNRTVLLIKVVLLAHCLEKLSESLQHSNGDMQSAFGDIVGWVKTRVRPSQSCSLLLGALTSSL